MKEKNNRILKRRNKKRIPKLRLIHILICTMRICVNLWVECAWWASISHSPHNSHEIYWNKIYIFEPDQKLKHENEKPAGNSKYFFLLTFTLCSFREQPHNTVQNSTHSTEQRRVHQGFNIYRWKQRQKIVAFSCRAVFFFSLGISFSFSTDFFIYFFFSYCIISCMIYYA